MEVQLHRREPEPDDKRKEVMLCRTQQEVGLVLKADPLIGSHDASSVEYQPSSIIRRYSRSTRPNHNFALSKQGADLGCRRDARLKSGRTASAFSNVTDGLFGLRRIVRLIHRKSRLAGVRATAQPIPRDAPATMATFCISLRR